MRKRKLLSLLVLLMTAATGAWADADVTWNSSNVSDLNFWGGAPDPYGSYTKEGVTLRGNAEMCDAVWYDYGDGPGINFNMNASGGYTFTAPDGKKFTKIEMTIYSFDGWYDAADDNQLGSGWPSGYTAAMTIYETNKVTWTGDATSTVDLLTDAGLSSFGGTTVSSIDFYFEAPSGPTVVASGDCGTGVTYSLTSDGVLTISGTGAMADYTAASGQPWYSYVSSITSVVVEAGVTHIGNSSFRDFTYMTSVSLPDGLETIGNYAFSGCTNASFTSITIPASVTSIGNNAFYSCEKLVSVIIVDNSNLTSIGSNAFARCTALESITTIPTSLTSIGASAFFNCIALSSFDIPASMTSIGDRVFYGCSSLSTVTIPASVTSIGQYAFYGCRSLSTITIPASVTSIGTYAFHSCSSLGSITIPAGVTSIENYTFYGCSSLGSIEIPAGVTSIGNSAFENCSSLSSVTIPASVTSIGSRAFGTCNLSSVTIPASVTSIAGRAFNNCSNLTTVTLYAPSCSLANSNAFGNCALENIYVFSDKVGDYQGATNWSTYVANIKANPDVTVSGVTARQNPDIATDNWCTYYHPQANVKINTTGVQIFKASLSGANLTLTEVDGDVIEAGQAVVLKATASGALDMELTPSAPTGDFSGNELKGTSVAITGAAGNIYVLNAKTGTGAGFYKLSTSGTLAANRAYLTYSGSGGAAREFFGFDETTSIESVSVNENFENGEVYDLQGRRVVNPTKGLYIVNGKKVFINK